MKIKSWDMSVLGDKPIQPKKKTDFYTTDTDAYLQFKLTDGGLTPNKATVTLYNIEDQSTVSESVDVEDNIVNFHMREEIIEHRGRWRVQVIFTDDGEDYTSALVTFSVGVYLLDNHVPSLEIEESWSKFARHARELIDGFEDEFDQLEETYAPRLTKVENNKADNVDLANTNEKLAIVKQRKADRSYVDRTKRSKEEKIKPDDLSNDVINLVTGESEVLINSIPQDYSVTANKLDQNLKTSLVLPVYNTINNGDFEKGVDGWSFYRGSGSALEGILSITPTPNSSYTSISQTSSTLGYGNLYVETRVKIPSEHNVDEVRLRIEIDGIVRNIELKTDFEKDRWFTLSGRLSADVHENCVISVIYFYEQGSQPVIELDYITCIDISEVPYTPTNSEIDVFLNNYSKRWYEGEGNWVSLENIYKEQAFLSNIMAEQDEEWKI